MSGSGRWWWIAPALALLSGGGSLTCLIVFAGCDLAFADFWTLMSLLLMPIMVLLLLPIMARACLELGAETAAKGELEVLLEQKHEGVLAQRARRVPDRAARVPHADSAPATGWDTGLDRLVRLKRQGDLARTCDDANGLNRCCGFS